MSKDEGGWNSSFCEKPVRPHPRRLVDWINLMGAKRVPFNSVLAKAKRGELQDHMKTKNADSRHGRVVDLFEPVAAMLRDFVGGRTMVWFFVNRMTANSCSGIF